MKKRENPHPHEYVPPLARLSVAEHQSLRFDNKRLKSYGKLEGQAAEMLGELSLPQLADGDCCRGCCTGR